MELFSYAMEYISDLEEWRDESVESSEGVAGGWSITQVHVVWFFVATVF